MAATGSNRNERRAFKDWALKTITTTPNHPLQCLVDDRTGKWHPNSINFPDAPSVDAGHTTSNWTGAPQCFALEDSDFNRNFNRGENKTRDGVFYQKPAVLLGKVPIERRTGEMLERTRQLKPSTVSAAYSPATGDFTIEGAASAPSRAPSAVPSHGRLDAPAERKTRRPARFPHRRKLHVADAPERPL